ncbi:MAG: hypothetical protein A2V90_01170, partial [Gammaproteobacteria bacterium RBG_16_57_12]
MTGDGAQGFDALVHEFYQAWFQFHPEQAVDAGVCGYADRLTPYDDDSIGALTVLLEKMLSALDEFDAATLDEDRRLDYAILQGSAQIELHDLLERDWRKRNPLRFIPIHAIYQLTVRKVDDFATAMRRRLAAIPAYLRGARLHLLELPEEIPAIWLETAIVEARSGAHYLHSLHRHPGVKSEVLDHLLEAAALAFQEFALFLEQEFSTRAQGSFACGRTHFERLLYRRHFLDLDADTLHAFGQGLYDNTLRDLKNVTRELRGDEDIAALTAAIQTDHPEPAGLLAAYQQQMQTAQKFLEHHALVSLPPRQRLTVVETPEFLRHQIPFAAYLEPSPNDERQQGYFYVSPATEADLLGEHNHPGLMHTCVHEAWPGHHLQFVTANSRAVSRTLPRLLNASATLYEGWALYCEQLMHEQGFLGQPEQRFILLRDRLWRALRVMIDVEIHTRGLGFDEAAEKMHRLLGFPLAQARADVTWYSLAPTVPMGYAAGWALINALRDRVRLEQGALDLRAFHDRLLASGSIAL